MKKESKQPENRKNKNNNQWVSTGLDKQEENRERRDGPAEKTENKILR